VVKLPVMGWEERQLIRPGGDTSDGRGGDGGLTGRLRETIFSAEASLILVLDPLDGAGKGGCSLVGVLGFV
jgi:hypothetical protein